MRSPKEAEHSTLCGDRQSWKERHAKTDLTHRPRKSVDTQDAIQNKRIKLLEKTALEQQLLINMLLTLVDPEDVQAALRLARCDDGLTHERLIEMADRCTPPADLFDAE